MIGVGIQTFNPASFITRIGDEKPVIILLKEDYILYLDHVDPTDLTTEGILSLLETLEEPLSLLPSDDELEAPVMEAPIKAEPLACYSPYTQTYYIPPPPQDRNVILSLS